MDDAAIEISTERLCIRKVDPVNDAEFLFRVANDPAYLRFIGDRGITSVGVAQTYLQGRVETDCIDGRGLFVARLKNEGFPVGITSLLRRPQLPAVDIGYAFLPEYRGQGYAVETAKAMVEYARGSLKLDRLVGVCSPENAGSIRLLQKLGMEFDGTIRWDESSPVESFVYVMNL